MLCGSIPPGVPPDVYVRLIEIARKKKVHTMLDTDGEALQRGIEAEPTAVHANQAEAERLLDTALLTRASFLDAARKLRAMGASSVVLSLGSRGAVGANGKSMVEALPGVTPCAPLPWTSSAAAFTGPWTKV
jgi:fructose-1-phosphate kinase PfkB-like protein